MEEREVRIVSAATPFVLRSAIHEVFEADPRFRSFLLPAGESLELFVNEVDADVAVLSASLDLPNVVSVGLLEDPPRIEIRIQGTAVLLPYTDLRSLDELVWLNRARPNRLQRKRGDPAHLPRRPLSDTGTSSHVSKGGR